MIPVYQQDMSIPGTNLPGMRRSQLLLGFALLAGSVAPMSPAQAAPANDNIANAVLVSSLPYRNARSTVGATRQTGEKSTSCGTPQATVWYEIKLPTAADVAITTSGSSFDTAMVLWRGTSRAFSALTFMDCVNDLGTERLAALGFAAAANVRYFVQIGTGGSSGTGGQLKLRITTGQQVLVPETSIGGAASLHARIVIAADSSEIEVVGRERLMICPVGFCFPLVDVGQEGSNVPAPAAHMCVTAAFFVYQCAGPQPGR